MFFLRFLITKNIFFYISICNTALFYLSKLFKLLYMNNIIILENTTVKGVGIMIAFDEDRKKKLAKYIGNNIYEYRKKNKFTREDLAEKSNLSANHIYELEMGNCMPTTITLIEICIALNISLTQLIDTRLLSNNNEVAETFINDFQKLTEREKKSIIQLIKYMANN